LGQPERHLHGAVQLDSRGEFGPRLLAPSHLTIQRAEVAVTVGLEWAHAQFIGQGEGLPVLVLRLFDRWGIALRSDLT
jgi:hypothetical protein